MKYMCPVCGYPNLEAQPTNHEICPSCGTQFGYDDYLRSYADLRQEWLRNGAEWFLSGYKPYGWNPYKQLQDAGFIEIDKTSKTKTTIGVSRTTRAFEIIRTGYGAISTSNRLLDTENTEIGVGRLVRA